MTTTRAGWLLRLLKPFQTSRWKYTLRNPENRLGWARWAAAHGQPAALRKWEAKAKR